MDIKYRQIIHNFSYAGEVSNITVVEWIDAQRQGDARNATPEDLAAVGDAIASGYLAQIVALEQAHADFIAKLQEAHADELAAAQGQAVPGGISKLVLMRRLVALGKWRTFKGLLAMLDEEVQDAWNLAQEIRPDDALFVANATALKTAMGLTNEEWDSLLIP